MSDSTAGDRQHVADLVSRARAVLTTTTQEGRHASHPMGLQEADVDGDLWFFAYDDSGKAAEIRANPEVAPLWSPTVTPWFPDGLETPC